MTLKIPFQILGFLCLINVGAQEIIISGKVTNGATGQPMEYASVALAEAASGLLISGAVCDSEGRYRITGELNGEYVISFSFVGFASLSREILIGELNKIYDLGVSEIYPLLENLEEVTVSAQSSTLSQELDKKTFSMDDMLAQSGGSVLDAMKTMPGVSVDQEGKIILRGSDKVVVLIDGKQSSLTGFGNQKGLGNIPAANIEKIEIINNPSAKYDARGMAGIINIIYKKESEEGFNGDIGFAYGIGALSKPKADLPTELGSFDKNSKYLPSLNMNSMFLPSIPKDGRMKPIT